MAADHCRMRMSLLDPHRPFGFLQSGPLTANILLEFYRSHDGIETANDTHEMQRARDNDWREATQLNGMPCRRPRCAAKRIACNASQLWTGAGYLATTSIVRTQWTHCGTKVLLGWQSHQGDRQPM
jgi:hypothetical protein